MIKHLALMAMICLGLRADSVTYTYTVTVSGYTYNGGALYLDVPQFNPADGTLDGDPTFTISDGQTLLFSGNEYGSEADQPYSFDAITGAVSSLLGLDASVTLYESQPGSDSGTTEWWQDGGTLEASGTVPDASPFIGTGDVEIPVSAFSTLDNYAGPGGIGLTIDNLTDNITFTITYQDSVLSAVPEPRWAAGFAGLVFIGFVFLRRTGVAAR